VKRAAPLKRRTRLKPKRETRRTSKRVHDTEYMERVRGLPCVVVEMMPLGPQSADIHGINAFLRWRCNGHIHAHHMGERGFGQKCSDLETVPFCDKHHAEWHDCRGVFAGKSREWRREFGRAAIEATQAALMPAEKGVG